MHTPGGYLKKNCKLRDCDGEVYEEKIRVQNSLRFDIKSDFKTIIVKDILNYNLFNNRKIREHLY